MTVFHLKESTVSFLKGLPAMQVGSSMRLSYETQGIFNSNNEQPHLKLTKYHNHLRIFKYRMMF